jgi:hypothetical protein
VIDAKTSPAFGGATFGTAGQYESASFFHYATQDDFGNPNPLAGQIGWVITRGSSQSGTFIRQLIHYGFTQDEANRQVYDGAWPIVAARRIGLNFRFAKPDLVMKLYEAGSEGPLWWYSFPDQARGNPIGGILDRCTRTKTCPKIVEHFGAAEVWGQKLTKGAGRHRRERRHSVAEERAQILFRRQPARRRRRRIQRHARKHSPVLRHELRPGYVSDQPDASNGNGQRAALPLPQLGDERHPSA